MSSAPPTPTMEVDTAHILAMVMQFLYEAGLTQSVTRLRDESRVRWFAAEEVTSLASLIESGSLSEFLLHPLSEYVTFDLYLDIFELIMVYLLQKGEMATVRDVLTANGRVAEEMKEKFPARWKRLTQLVEISRDTNYWGSIYGTETEEVIRKRLARAVVKDLHNVYELAPSELLLRLGKSLVKAKPIVAKPVSNVTIEKVPSLDLPTLSATRPISHRIKTLTLSNLPNSESINAMVFAPWEKGILAIATLNEILLLDSISLQPLANQPAFPFKGCIHLAFDEKGQYLAAAGVSGDVQCWNIPQNRLILTASKVHQEGAFQVAFTQLEDNLYLVSGGVDQSLCFWSLDRTRAEAKLLCRLRLSSLETFAFLRPGLIITAGASRQCTLIEARHNEWLIIGTLDLQNMAANSLIEPQVRHLVTDGNQTFLVMVNGQVGSLQWPSKQFRQLGQLSLKMGGIHNGLCVVDKQGQYMYLADDNGDVHCFHLAVDNVATTSSSLAHTSTIITTLESEPMVIAINSVNNYLVVADANNQIHIFQ